MFILVWHGLWCSRRIKTRRVRLAKHVGFFDLSLSFSLNFEGSQHLECCIAPILVFRCSLVPMLALPGGVNKSAFLRYTQHNVKAIVHTSQALADPKPRLFVTRSVKCLGNWKKAGTVLQVPQWPLPQHTRKASFHDVFWWCTSAIGNKNAPFLLPNRKTKRSVDADVRFESRHIKRCNILIVNSAYSWFINSPHRITAN